MDRNQEYIRLLQEKNRIKKMMTEKSDEDLAKEELERGFSTHFRGAHAGKEPPVTSKATVSKPTVKNHTKTPNGDLLQRLMAPTLTAEDQCNHDNGRLGLEQENDDEEHMVGATIFSQRSGSRGASRYRNIPRDQDPHQLSCVNLDGQDRLVGVVLDNGSSVDEIKRTSEPKPHYSEPLEPPLQFTAQEDVSLFAVSDGLDLMQSADLNSMLLGHIQGLTAQQKIAMIQLLQQTNPAPAQPIRLPPTTNKLVSDRDDLIATNTTPSRKLLFDDCVEVVKTELEPTIATPLGGLTVQGTCSLVLPCYLNDMKISNYLLFNISHISV
jgi:hypothetical protein